MSLPHREKQNIKIIEFVYENEKKYVLFIIVESIILLLIYFYRIYDLYGFTLSTDELGYWGNAAYFAGYDWGNVLNNMPYYSYGYSFILMFILKLPLSTEFLYKTAISLNAVYMLISFGISFYLFRRLFPNRSKYIVNICCFAASLYSAYIAFSNFVIPECFLVMMTWILILQAYLICKKNTVLRTIFFCIELAYIYMVHMRTLTYIIAGIIFLIYLHWSEAKVEGRLFTKKRLVLVLAGIFLLAGFCTAGFLKQYVQAELYDTGTILANDYGSIIKSISITNIFMPSINSLVSETFYLWIASVGLIPVGFIYSCISYYSHKIENDKLKCFFLFTLLLFLGEFALSVFIIRSEGMVARLDYFVYGRYMENAIPFLLTMGLIHFVDIVRDRKKTLYSIFALAVFLVISCAFNNRIESCNIDDLSTFYYQGACAAGSFWLYLKGGFSVYFFCKVVLLMQIMFLGLLYFFKEKYFIYLAEILLIVFYWLANGYAVLNNQTILYQDLYCYTLANEPAFFEEIRNSNYQVGFLSGYEYDRRGNIQLYLRDVPLTCIDKDFDTSSLKNIPEIIIVEHQGDIENIDVQMNKLIEKNEFYYLGNLGHYQIYAMEGIHIESL